LENSVGFLLREFGLLSFPRKVVSSIVFFLVAVQIANQGSLTSIKQRLGKMRLEADRRFPPAVIWS
jgi:hypothetical protein